MSDLILDVPRETNGRLADYVSMLLEENRRQNLIARSTERDVWDRHIKDSFQLLAHAPDGLWLDIGSGAGLPGMVAAIARPDQDVVLVEPRARRAEFLTHVAHVLALPHVRVIASRIETTDGLHASVITARAVAPLHRLFDMGVAHAASECVWLLSKGRAAAAELAVACRTWQGRFSLIPSETDPEAAIVMARDVQPLRQSRPRR